MISDYLKKRYIEKINNNAIYYDIYENYVIVNYSDLSSDDLIYKYYLCRKMNNEFIKLELLNDIYIKNINMFFSYEIFIDYIIKCIKKTNIIIDKLDFITNDIKDNYLNLNLVSNSKYNITESIGLYNILNNVDYDKDKKKSDIFFLHNQLPSFNLYFRSFDIKNALSKEDLSNIKNISNKVKEYNNIKSINTSVNYISISKIKSIKVNFKIII